MRELKQPPGYIRVSNFSYPVGGREGRCESLRLSGFGGAVARLDYLDDMPRVFRCAGRGNAFAHPVHQLHDVLENVCLFEFAMLPGDVRKQDIIAMPRRIRLGSSRIVEGFSVPFRTGDAAFCSIEIGLAEGR